MKGEKAGQKEVFIDNLPKVPDNIRPSKNGGYWVGLAPGPVRHAGKWFSIPEWFGERPWFRKQITKVCLGVNQILQLFSVIDEKFL